jgi:hypothetical protein
MARSFIELIYIDSKDLAARHTNMQWQGATDAQTWAKFRSLRRFSTDIKRAKFLVDYHNRKGDLGDTIAIDADAFREITGQAPKSDAAYRKIDRQYWNDATEAANG